MRLQREPPNLCQAKGCKQIRANKSEDNAPIFAVLVQTQSSRQLIRILRLAEAGNGCLQNAAPVLHRKLGACTFWPQPLEEGCTIEVAHLAHALFKLEQLIAQILLIGLEAQAAERKLECELSQSKHKRSERTGRGSPQSSTDQAGKTPADQGPPDAAREQARASRLGTASPLPR